MARTRVDWPALRSAYKSGCGIEDLCQRFDVARQTLMRKVRTEDWPAQTSPPTPALPKRGRRRPILSRLFSALEMTMSDLEDRLLKQTSATAAERERDAKLLGSMAALYEKLKEMQADERKGRKSPPRGGQKRSADHLRDELAARLDGLRRGKPD